MIVRNGAGPARCSDSGEAQKQKCQSADSAFSAPTPKRRAACDCPHCGRPMPAVRLGVALSSLKARIFDAVARGGIDGIPCDDLYELVFRSRGVSRACLKAHVWQLNERIADEGHRVVSDGRSYRLMTFSEMQQRTQGRR